MRFLGNLLRRHWGMLLMLAAAAIAVAVILTVPVARSGSIALWQRAVTWAGFGTTAGESGTVYWCPMHPQIKRKNANDVCPICNMALVPLEGGGLEAPEELKLTTRQIQQTGISIEPVLRRQLYREIDTTGRIAGDERREAIITSWVRGKSRIEKLYINFTGARVEQGDLMAELYSPDLIVAQQEFLMTDSTSRLPGLNLRLSAAQKLRDQGMTDEQIDRLATTREVLERVPVYAPLSGTVLERSVQQGEYVSEGDVLFQIVNLENVWLLADIYEEELPLVELGQSVVISVASFPGETFEGTVSFIDAVVDPQSRTVQVRIEIPNEDRQLKPGMYARAQLHTALRETLAVPENAVLWSGKRRVSIVRQSEGAFQPREIELGRRWLYARQPEYRPGGRIDFGSDVMRYHEVLSGLSPGEEVVTAGAFLLSAESQFQSVLTKMLLPEEQSATLGEAIGEELAQGIRKLLNAYFSLTQSLAADDLEEAHEGFRVLHQAAEELAQRASQQQRPELGVSAGAIAAQAEQAAAEPPADLHEARSRFARISRQTVQLLAENGGQTLFGKDLFLFRCGMSGVGYENWLWWSDEKLNPYMGPKMLTCGSQLDSLQP